MHLIDNYDNKLNSDLIAISLKSNSSKKFLKTISSSGKFHKVLYLLNMEVNVTQVTWNSITTNKNKTIV